MMTTQITLKEYAKAKGYERASSIRKLIHKQGGEKAKGLTLPDVLHMEKIGRDWILTVPATLLQK